MKKLTKQSAQQIDQNDDITNPTHNQGLKFRITEDNFIQQTAEPPSKPAGGTEEPTLGEDE